LNATVARHNAKDMGNVIADSKRRRVRKMGEQAIDETKIVIVIVGFKQDQENSVHYEKLHDPTPDSVGMSLWKAFIKGADFASVRFIKQKETS
jgi:hypothetical protein